MLAILVLLVVLVGGCSFLVFNATRGVIDAANVYVANIDDGDFDAAYSSLCSQIQSSTTSAEWAEDLNARLRDGEITDYNFNSFNVTNNSVATVSGTIEIDGFEQTSILELVNENDTWRVCSRNPLG